jgi:alkylation response protein AidB-like acyl-CoA dehydrogenase
MQFRFDDDQLAMRDAVRSLCADHLDFAGVAGREGKPADPALWAALADLGVLGMLGDTPGSAIGIAAASIVFEELGAHLVTGPVLWSTLAAQFVAGIADGDLRVAGVAVDEEAVGPVVVEHLEECDALLVLRPDRIEMCARPELAAATDGAPFDPLTPVAVLPAVPAGEAIADEAAAQRVRRCGEVLSAALLIGVAQRALDVAREYALEREQFGAPIGSFQAIKHLLADMYVAVELARAATYAAAAVVADPRTGDPDRTAAAAKLLAGEAGIGNGRTAVQILGGMGFTWDMPPHYLLKRAWVLEHVFGTGPAHAARLGQAVGEEVGAK